MKLQDKTGAARRTPLIRLSPLAVSLLLTLAGPAVATESTQTPQLVGNKPKVSNVQLKPDVFTPGQWAWVEYSYSDEDGDPEEKSVFEWLINGQVVTGQTEWKLILPQDSGGKTLQVKVTPKSAPPAMPAAGDPVTSAMTMITSQSCFNSSNFKIGNTTYDCRVAYKSYGEGGKYCSSIGRRQTTQAELLNVYRSSGATEGSVCSQYGINCDNKDIYWSSTKAGNNYINVNLKTGVWKSDGYGSGGQVLCAY
ncbi:hypothetical protein ACK34T_19450 [Aeromonas veronii]